MGTKQSVLKIKGGTVVGLRVDKLSFLRVVVVPEGVETIASEAFKGRANLTSVTLPQTLTSVENSAFAACRGITSLTLPNSLTSVTNFVFQDCSPDSLGRPTPWDQSGMQFPLTRELYPL